MDDGFEDLELREVQREYLDFLDDNVNTRKLVLIFNLKKKKMPIRPPWVVVSLFYIFLHGGFFFY